MRRKSIVTQSSLMATLAILCVTFTAFSYLYYTQKNTLEKKLVADGVENIEKVTRFLLGFFYSQGNWVHLRQHQKHLQSTPNILYAYILNEEGEIAFGIDGHGSQEVGASRQNWEPATSGDRDHLQSVRFSASPELVARFPNQLQVGDPLVLISSSFVCPEYQRSCARLHVAMTFAGVSATLKNLKNSLIATGLLITLISGLMVFLIVRRNMEPIRRVSRTLEQLANQNPSSSGLSLKKQGIKDVAELSSFGQALEKFVTAKQQAAALEQELITSRTLSDHAARVAHDIRSPLAALESVVTELNQLPEQVRVIVRGSIMRIRDIANKLIDQKERQPETTSPYKKHLVAGLLDRIYTEKVTQFRSRTNLHLQFSLAAHHYELFAFIDGNEFLRCISNLIDNAVQAISASGKVNLELKREGKDILVSVSDTGCGIPADQLEKVFEKGFSLNKTTGSGLGLYYTKFMVKRWQGSVEIKSKLGHGTTVTLRLPLATPPGWFTREILLSATSCVAVLGDDQFIHDVWQRRLKSISQELDINHFTSAKDFLQWLKAAQASKRDFVFLIDYELRDDSITGIDVIKICQQHGQAVLVTSRYGETSVQEQCQQLAIKLLPKEASHLIPVAFTKSEDERIAAYLFDDDPWTCEAWSLAAEKQGLKLQTRDSGKQAKALAASLDCRTPVFVDLHLGSEDGREVAKTFIEAGFDQVYIATGVPEESLIKDIPQLAGIIGKDFPTDILKGL